MRKNFHDAANIHRAVLVLCCYGWWLRGWSRRWRWRAKGFGRNHRFAHLSGDPAYELAIGGMTGLDRDEMTVQWTAKQRKGAENIQDLMPNEFIGIAQSFGGQDGIIPNHNGILETAAFDQAVLDEILDLLEKTERPRMGQVALPRFR